MVVERALRSTPSAKTFERGSFDRGSTLLVGATFGAGLILPIVTVALGIAPFKINLFEGLSALFVMIIGLGFRIWAARTLGKYYSRTLLTVEGQNVVKAGPYKRIRHPGYLGAILLWSGFGVLSSNIALGVLYPIMFIVTYLYRIWVEEGMLVKSLGEEYVAYQKRTSKLVPGIY